MARAPDQLLGTLNGEQLQELSPVGEMKAVEDPGRPVA
jgi:hypothetical protein